LGEDWPGGQRTKDFTDKAEGLFIWVYIVTEYLRTVARPDKKLSTLLYERNLSGFPAEEKMDALYAEILASIDWSDEDSVQDYQLLAGAIIAAKTPLSLSTLQSLHRANLGLDIAGALLPLSSLLTGLFDNNQPIQILHLSFRDFLTYRAQSSSVHKRFHVSEKEHSHRLAILCLHVLNEDLTSETPGAGYLTGSTPDTEGIPFVNKSDISEVLWYSCRFWTEHIIEIEDPAPGIILDSLRVFFAKRLTVWVEVLNTQYPFQSLSKVRTWFLVSVPMQSLQCTGVDLFAESMSKRTGALKRDI
jgi:hypothetical protein